MKEVVIAAAVRTPIGSFGGVLKKFTAPQLGAEAIKAAVKNAGISPQSVEEVLMGCVIQANIGQAPARQASRYAGLPDEVNCTTVNKVCASGMKAIAQGTQSILLGDADIIVAGGMESMSNIPFYADAVRWGNKYGNTALVDGLVKDGLTDAYDGKAMGLAAELCARDCGLSRQEQDIFAIESYRRAQYAWENGFFDAEVVPLEIMEKKGTLTIISKDEEPYNVKFDRITTLNPAFEKNGTVTAANASTLNDGAAALVLMSADKARELGVKPMGCIRGYADAEQTPEWFTTTPAIALPRAIQKAGITPESIDLWEINEAFSVVALENSRRLKLDPAKVNVHGGAVSLGHPLGASGARIVVTLLHALRQRKARYGAAGICNGGGGASALVIEAYV